MEIVFTELLLFKRTQYVMKNMRKSLGQVIVCLRKIQRSLNRNFSSRTLWRILLGKARSRELRQKLWTYYQLCITPYDQFVSLIVTEERVQFWAKYRSWLVLIHHNKEAVYNTARAYVNFANEFHTLKRRVVRRAYTVFFFCAHGWKKCATYVPLSFSAISFLRITLLCKTKNF